MEIFKKSDCLNITRLYETETVVSLLFLYSENSCIFREKDRTELCKSKKKSCSSFIYLELLRPL